MSFNLALANYYRLSKLVTLLDAPGMGGNISVKYDDSIMIKSSGQNMKVDHIITTCDNNGQTKYSYDFTDECVIDAIKPSMEIGMHMNLKCKYVFHYHPAYVLPYLCSVGSDDQLITGHVIEYVSPGEELAQSVIGVDSEIIWLKNHGVVLQSDSIERIEELYYIIKSEYFGTTYNDTAYTPDDVVDSNNLELWLFRQYIEYTASKRFLQLKSLTDECKSKLLSDSNEKYRMSVK